MWAGTCAADLMCLCLCFDVGRDIVLPMLAGAAGAPHGDLIQVTHAGQSTLAVHVPFIVHGTKLLLAGQHMPWWYSF